MFFSLFFTAVQAVYFHCVARYTVLHLIYPPPPYSHSKTVPFLSGKYRGAAHSACNLLLKIDPRQHTTPVVFHNLRGYDSHFLVANLGSSAYKEHYVDRNGHPQVKTVGGVSVIANNMERFMSFTWNRFRFIDSYQFLSASLDRLASSTPDDALLLSSTLDNHCLLKRKGMESYARIMFLWVS